MKIVYFMNNEDKGGAALALIDLVKVIKKKYPNIEPIVVTGKNNSINIELTKLGIENYSSSFRNFISSKKQPSILWTIAYKIRHDIGNYFSIKDLEKKIDFSKIDLIHSNLNRIDIGALLSKKYNIPHVWHLREHVRIHFGNSLLDDSKAKGFDVISIYNDPIDYMERFNSKYIAISESVKQEWITKGLSEEKIEKVYDGVDILNHKEIYKKDNERIRIVFLGGLVKAKGQEDFLKLFINMPTELLSEFELDFFGEGSREYKKYLLSIVENNKLAKIRFMEYDPRIRTKLVNYDIGVNVSYHEGFGRVFVEYMNSGLCVLCTENGGSNELIEDKVTGFFVDRYNQHKFNCLMSDIVKDRELIHKIGLYSIEKSQNFSIDKHVHNVVAVYNTLKRR